MLVEEFAVRVLRAEQEGTPAISLRSVTPASADDVLNIAGLRLPSRHPAILGGAPGDGKSLLALYGAGLLANQGGCVLLCDSELGPEEHRSRLDALFGSDTPNILYARLEKPLVHEIDRLARIVADEGVTYVVVDSLSFAAAGPLEEAQTATGYYQAVRQLGPVGSLHVCHKSKADEEGRGPFGSIFWTAGARTIYMVARSQHAPSGTLEIAAHCRKMNLGPLAPTTGLRFTWEGSRAYVAPLDVAESPDLAGGLSLTARIRASLRSGAKTRAALANDLEDIKPDTLTRVVRRELSRGRLIKFPSAAGIPERIGLAEGDRS